MRSRTVSRAAVMLLGLALCAGHARAQRADSAAARDSTARRAAVARDTLTGPVVPTAFGDSATRAALSRRDSVTLRALPGPARDTTARSVVPARSSQPSGPSPPLNISADNVTGSHGPEGDIVLLNGNVRVTRARTVLTADAGRYLRADGRLDLDGRVKMVDSTATLTCDHATYSENDDRLDVSGHVTITDREAVLHAPVGTYDRRTSRLDLSGGVTGKDRNQQLFADRVTYDRDSMVVHARDHVRGLDDTQKTELLAQAVDFNRRTHEAVATGDPLLRSRDDRDHVTEVRARTLRLNTESRIAEAVDSVTVVRDTLRGRADYALFDDHLGRGWLLGNPRLWDNENVVVGDTLEIWSEKRVLKKARVYNNAVMDYRGARPTTLGETSRLSGRMIEVYFTRDAIDSLVATEEAHDDYQAPARAGLTGERNQARGDTITVFFEDRKIDRARVEGNASGEYRPAVDIGDTLAARRELVQYDAPHIEFIVPKSRIVLDRAAHLIYGDLELRARRVQYDVEKQTLAAEGNPRLVDRGEQVSGHLMTYDMASRVGTIYKAETAYEKGLYHGEKIRKVNENELDVLNGSYSTCDLPEPHYHFASHYMKIFLKDKLVAKPVVFYVRHVPLFALPFYVFPIKPGRHSGFLFPQFEFGFSNKSGQFLRNAGYYWAPNDYMDLALSGDYYQAEPSWVVRAESQYKLLYALDGSVNGTFARNQRLRRDDYDFTADHAQTLGERTRLVARGAFVSSRDYNSSNLYGRSLAQRLNRFLTSSLALSHSASWANFNAVMDRRQDLDADFSIADPDGTGPLHGPQAGTVASLPNLTETLPSVSVSFPTRTIGTLGPLKGTRLERPLKTLYFSLDSRFVSQRERRAYVSGYRQFLRDTIPDSTTVLSQRVSERRAFAANAALSDSRRLFGWLTFAPRFNASGVVFDFDALGNKVVPTGTWSASMVTGTTLYGTFRTHLGPLVGLRHVIFPSASFSFSPDFPNLNYRDSLGVLRSRFVGFGGFGVSGFKQATLNFALDQRLQAKLRKGDQVERLDNLVSWNLAGSYNFLWRERGLAHPLSMIGSNLFVQPPGLLSASVSWVTDVYSQRPLRSLGGSSGFTLSSHRGGKPSEPPALPVEQTRTRSYQETNQVLSDTWTLNVAYSYAGGYQGPRWANQQTANAVLHYQVSPAWQLDYSTSYDITQRNLLTQRYGITRDLHCWQASFTRTFTPGGEAEYYFRLGIKEQREVYIERGTRVGSLGGIQ